MEARTLTVRVADDGTVTIPHQEVAILVGFQHYGQEFRIEE